MKNQTQNILDSNRTANLLIKLSLPMLLGMAVQAIYSILDTVFIGHYVGTAGIASLAVVFPLQMFTMGIASMIGIGGGSLISRLIGSGEQKNAERALGNSICFSILFSAAIMIGVLPFVNFWIDLVGASGNVLPIARDFLLISFSGTLFNILNNVLLYMVRAEGNARVTMVSMILQSILAIVLDVVFIISLHLGIRGAALATVISQATSVAYLLSFYMTKSSYLKIKLANFYPDRNILKSIFAIGISQFVQSIAGSLSAMFIVRMAATYGGDIALSAFGIIQRVMWFSSIPSMVLGQGLQPILGYNYGAKRYHQAIRVINLAILWSVIFSFLAFLVFFVVPGPVIRIFTSDISLVEATVFAVRRIFLVLPLFGFFAVGQMVFPSVGKAKESFILALARPLVFMTPLVLILPHFYQINGVWLAFPGSDVLSCILNVAMLVPLFREFRKAAMNIPPGPGAPFSNDNLLEYQEPSGVAK